MNKYWEVKKGQTYELTPCVLCKQLDTEKDIQAGGHHEPPIYMCSKCHKELRGCKEAKD